MSSLTATALRRPTSLRLSEGGDVRRLAATGPEGTETIKV